MLLMDTIFFFFNYTATTEIYTLSLHDALPISADFYRPAHQIIYDTVLDLYGKGEPADPLTVAAELTRQGQIARRSEEHTSELQSRQYLVCRLLLEKKKNIQYTQIALYAHTPLV